MALFIPQWFVDCPPLTGTFRPREKIPGRGMLCRPKNSVTEIGRPCFPTLVAQKLCDHGFVALPQETSILS